MDLETLGYFIGVPMTIFIYSYALYKDNPTFKFAEYTGIAAALANATVIAIEFTRDNWASPILEGTMSPLYIIVMGIGLLYLMRYTDPQYRWLVRYPVAIMIGTRVGILMRGDIEASIVNRTIGLMRNIFNFNNFVILIFAVPVLLYFIMSREYTGSMKHTLKLGKWAMMISFGAILGTRVATFVSWCAARILYILEALSLA
jgi:hypothetical protein